MKLPGGIWLVCLLPTLLSANPLGMLTGDDLFEGEYSHAQLTLSIDKAGQHYQGIIQQGEQRYPFKASRQDAVLRGFFNDGQQHYPLRLLHQDHTLILETGTARYHLNRVTALPAATPPTAAPSPPVTTPPPAALDYTTLSIATSLHLHQFIGGLRYWLSGAVTEQQAVYLMQNHLLPETATLSQQLKQLETLLGATLLSTQLDNAERQYVRTLIELSSKGSRFFQDWHDLLDNLLHLRRSGDQAGLVQLTASRLPSAVKGSIAYLRDFTVLVRATGEIQSLQNTALPDSASLAPDKILKWEMLRNMSEAMREGMDIFKLWRGK